ncbi:MAG: hypothetical protein ACOY5B_17210 [Spirochaetota bacterium]
MKKILAMLAVLSLIGAVHAQKKAKPAAKPAAKIDAAKADADAKAKAAQDAANAKAADVQNKANEKLAAATAVDESKFSISVWGGYGIATKSDYVKTRETIFSNLTGATDLSATTKNGGIAAGADFFYGSTFQIGASAAYLQGHDVTRKVTSGGTTYTITNTMNYVPVLLSARYFVVPGLYVGAGVGVASVQQGVEKASPAVNLASGNAYDITYSGTAVTLQGRLGYDYAVSPSFTIGVAGIFTYVMSDLEGGKLKDDQDLVLEKVSNNFLNIAPSLVLTYKM